MVDELRHVWGATFRRRPGTPPWPAWLGQGPIGDGALGEARVPPRSAGLRIVEQDRRRSDGDPAPGRPGAVARACAVPKGMDDEGEFRAELNRSCLPGLVRVAAHPRPE